MEICLLHIVLLHIISIFHLQNWVVSVIKLIPLTISFYLFRIFVPTRLIFLHIEIRCIATLSYLFEYKWKYLEGDTSNIIIRIEEEKWNDNVSKSAVTTVGDTSIIFVLCWFDKEREVLFNVFCLKRTWLSFIFWRYNNG